MSDLRNASTDALFKAILSLKDEEECYAFFEDLCTVGELQAMSQRYHVARLLNDGLVYSEVGRLSGASSATISRVNRCLQYGSGGYRTLLEREKK
jgi:TrpR-related protein YerC/YecD